MTIQELENAVRTSWIKRADSGPIELLRSGEQSAGQCAVTALVVQDYFGGQILNTVATNPKYPGLSSSHYFNLINGRVVDLTRQQFKDDVIFSEAQPKLNGFNSTREYMLSFSSTVERYELLKSNVERLLIDQ